jgi:hypothetical protein
VVYFGICEPAQAQKEQTESEASGGTALCGLRRFHLVHDLLGGAAPTASSADANSPVSIASISRKYLFKWLGKLQLRDTGVTISLLRAHRGENPREP